MIDLTGLSLAVFAAFFFGTYYVPLKRINIDYYTYQFFVGIGALAAGISASVWLKIPLEVNIIGLIPGITWTVANLISANAIKYMGVSGVAIAQAVIVLVSFLWGIIFFQEPFQSIVLAVAGVSLLILGLPLISARDGRSNIRKGFLLFVLAGILWGSVYVPPLMYKISTGSIIPSMMFGIFVSGVLVFFAGKKHTSTSYALNSISSGVLWAVGNVAAALSVDYIGLALAGPIPQLAMLVSMAWGILYFKEVREKGKVAKVIVGGVVLVIGVILLALAK
jgi:glucose uptake protein GlcU